MERIAIFRPLVNEDRHDGELIVWLQPNRFGDQKLSLAVNKRARGFYDRTASGRTEIAGDAGSVLNTESVITTVPLEMLEFESKGFTAAGCECRAGWGCTAFARREIKPGTVKTQWSLHVIPADINVALCVITILGRDIGPRASQKGYGQLRVAH